MKLWKLYVEPEADNLKIRAYKTLRGHTASVQSLAAPRSGDMGVGSYVMRLRPVASSATKHYASGTKEVRAGISGYPNVGKSSLTNRLLKRRMCPAAPRQGVTRVLKFARLKMGLSVQSDIPLFLNQIKCIFFSISEIAEIARANGALLMVDNSIMSPVLCRPLELGADIVMNAATKFVAGHSNVMAGVLSIKGERLGEELYFLQNSEGAGLAPFDC